jgi:hypothetical protein
MFLLATAVGLVMLVALASTDVLIADIGSDELNHMGVQREPK